MLKHLLYYLILFVFIPVPSWGNINFHQLDIKSGISDNFIQSIVKDQYGFMWFATRNGVNRYDGYSFKHYTTIELGAYNNDVEWIAEDASGTLWLKTPVNYCYYNREKDVFMNSIHLPLEQLGIQTAISKLFIDEDKDIWCTAGDTLFHYVFDKGELLSYTIPEKAEVVHLSSRKLNSYLLLSNNEIARVDTTNNTLKVEYTTICADAYRPRLYLDTTLTLWVYTSQGTYLSSYDTKSKIKASFPGSEMFYKEDNIIMSLIDDGMGNIWIGTDNQGIYVCNSLRKEFQHYYREKNEVFTLPSNHINCFFKDDRGVMWIGTSKQGVAYANMDKNAFKNHKLLLNEDVNCLIEDNKGDLWLGYDGEGIEQYRLNGRRVHYQKGERNLPSNLIVCSFIDSKERIWWGSYGGGAFFLFNDIFIPLQTLVQNDNGNEIPLHIRRITEDNNGNIWLATYTQGLFCLDTHGTLSKYTRANSPLLTDYIADISYSSGRELFIATSSGVYCMDIITKEMVYASETSDGRPIIQDNYANCIYQDSRGLLWVGGRRGINIYNKKDDSLVYLGENEGLTHTYIRAIIEDNNKNMWIATDHGITHVYIINDPNMKELKYICYPYFEADGIDNFTFNNFSITRKRNNELLVGGSGGYLSIYPDMVGYTPRNQNVIFTAFFLANQAIEVDSVTLDGRTLLKKNIQLADAIYLDYSDHNFALEISAMDYGNLHKLEYAYRFSNKGEWIKLEGNRIYFNKLSPGKYDLEVKVIEPFQSDQIRTSRLSIYIKPPFWLSPIGYICYIILAISMVVYTVLRVRSKHRKQLRTQKHEIELNQQLKMEEAKMRFFTNVSHDLRTPLSLVITPLEHLLRKVETNEMRSELTLIHRNATMLLDEVDQLLDFRNIDECKTQLSHSFGNLSDFVKEVCTPFHQITALNGITVLLEVHSPTIEMNFDRNKMKRVILNLVSNAIKYNVTNGTVKIIVDRIVTKEGEQARIRVVDTGVGILPENKEKIFERFFQEEHHTTTYAGNGIGLNIVKEYVQMHGGTISVADNQPSGSIFIVMLPINGTTTHLTSTPTLVDSVASPQSVGNKNDKPNILVVEDNDDFRQFIVRCLSDHYQVFDAPDGKKALNILFKESIQMVISDVMMPVMDGMELCRKMKTDIRISHIPIILLTARTAEEHVLNGLKEGADDYITKPFNTDILLLRINKLLEWTNMNHQKFNTIDISPSEITISSLDEQLIKKAIQGVEENIDNSNFSVEELSAFVGMSRGHLYKKLISITGKSPVEFIRVLRIKRGRQLLEQSQLNITQISYEIGLSQNQFTKYFKDEYGCLPSKYLKSKVEGKG